MQQRTSAAIYWRPRSSCSTYRALDGVGLAAVRIVFTAVKTILNLGPTPRDPGISSLWKPSPTLSYLCILGGQ